MKQLLITPLFLLTLPALAQNWGRNTESAFVNEALDVEVDAAGNTYTTGYITGGTAFDVTVVQPSAAGNGDIYVAKYAQNGSLTWVEQFGGNFSDRAYDLCIDQVGNICITGQFYGSVTFGATTLTSASNSKDIFLAKLSPSGAVLWARKEGGAGSENAYGITTDSQNNVILTGQFEGTSIIAGSTFTSITDPSTGLPSYDLFISKYDSNGNPLWVRNGSADYEDRGLAVHTDANNNIFMTGQFSDSIVFAGQTINSNGYNVGFLAKFNPAGQLQWLNTLRAGLVLPYDVEVNNVNEVVVIGDFLGTLQYSDVSGIHSISNPYEKQIFVLKTDNNGVYEWAETLGSENALSARAVAVDNAKDIYITGYFTCGWSELRTIQSAIFNSVGEKDAYLWKVGNNGSSLFVKQFGGQKNDIGHGVAIRNSIDPIVCGSYTDNLNIPKDIFASYSISTDNYDFFDAYTPSYVFLQGDESQNSFVTNAVHSLTPTYNFFEGQPNDSLYGNIIPDVDTMNYCEQGSVYYSPNTYNDYGPEYSYLWNTGAITDGISVSTTGTYSVEVSRMDGCSQGGDTIVVIIHQLPALPSMTDNLGLAVNAPGSTYYNYVVCFPDSVQTWFNGLDPSYSFSVGNIYTDTLPHYYAQDGTYEVSVSDAWCTNEGWFTITSEVTNQPEIEPYIMMQNNGMYTDSITICWGEDVVFDLLDSLENPTAIFAQYPSDTLVDVLWTSNPSMGGAQYNYFYETTPTTTGWYTITYNGIFGYDNSCGLDTIHRNAIDSFYIEVLPTPTATTNILGDDQICPGGSVYLAVSNVIPGLSWDGPGIVWTSATGDSVQVTLAGAYSYSGAFIDPLTGCSSNLSFGHILIEKLPPFIITGPLDAIICPYDSVLMSVADIYSSYNWTGPMGSGLSSTYQHLDDEQGFYYVTVVDSTGCSLTSAPAEIKEYTSPFLTTEPTNIICSNEFVNILAVFEGNGQANWTSPIISTASQLTVNQPGWYFCEMEQCGITVYDSIQLIDGSFTANLTLSDSVLCYGDSSIVSAPIGLSSYDWSTGVSGVASIVVSNAGNYSATVMNSYGCLQETDTVLVSFVVGSEPPALSDVTGCVGDAIVIQNLVPNPTNWYTSDTTFISSGFELILNNQTTNATILASYGAFGTCSASYDEILITLEDSIPDYPIVGNTTLCSESNSSFSIAANGESIEWFVNGISVGAGTSISFPSGVLNDADVLSVELSNACFTNTVSTTITILPSPVANFGSDTMYLCYGSDVTLELTQNFSNTEWSGDFGSDFGSQFDVFNVTNDGIVYAYATDVNGCASNTASIYLSIAQGGVSIESIPSLCQGDSVDLLTISPLDSIVWTTPFGMVVGDSFSLIANDGTAGMYTAVAYDSSGCEYTDSLELIYFDYPEFSIPEDTILCLDTYLNFENLPATNYYTWNGNSILDSMAVGQNQWLIVEATSPQGCVTIDSVYIETVDCNAALTNVFTPNGDGINDYFIIHLVPIYPDNSLIIVNRWGNVIYDVDRYDNTYFADGVPDGTYFYYFYTKGREYPDSVIQGTVTILRN